MRDSHLAVPGLRRGTCTVTPDKSEITDENYCSRNRCQKVPAQRVSGVEPGPWSGYVQLSDDDPRRKALTRRPANVYPSSQPGQTPLIDSS